MSEEMSEEDEDLDFFSQLALEEEGIMADEPAEEEEEETAVSFIPSQTFAVTSPLATTKPFIAPATTQTFTILQPPTTRLTVAPAFTMLQPPATQTFTLAQPPITKPLSAPTFTIAQPPVTKPLTAPTFAIAQPPAAQTFALARPSIAQPSIAQPSVTKPLTIAQPSQPAAQTFTLAQPSVTKPLTIAQPPQPALILNVVPSQLTMGAPPKFPQVITSAGASFQQLSIPSKPVIAKTVSDIIKQDSDEGEQRYKFRYEYTILAEKILRGLSNYMSTEQIISIGRAKTSKLYERTSYPPEIEKIIGQIDSTQ